MSFFNKDPFPPIEKLDTQSLMSHDIGPFQHNSFQVPQCYGERAKTWSNTTRPLLNACVWGGEMTTALCMLDCIKSQLEDLGYNDRNCDMPVVDWCAHFSGCINSTFGTDTGMVNEFREDCLKPETPIIHNKCEISEHKTCLVFNVTSGSLILPRESPPCARLSI